MLRGAIFGVASAAAVAILARRLPGWPAPLAAFAVAGMGAFIVGSLPGGVSSVGPVVFALDAWCLATPCIVWMLAGTLFRDDFHPGPLHLAVVGGIVIVTFAGDWGRYRLGPLAADPELGRLLFLAGRVTALGLLAAACGFALAHWRADLVETRRRARAVFVGLIAVVFAALAASDFVFGPAGVKLEWLALGHVAADGVRVRRAADRRARGLGRAPVGARRRRGRPSAHGDRHRRRAGSGRSPRRRDAPFRRGRNRARAARDGGDGDGSPLEARGPRHRGPRAGARGRRNTCCDGRSTAGSATGTSTTSCTTIDWPRWRAASPTPPSGICRC